MADDASVEAALPAVTTARAALDMLARGGDDGRRAQMLEAAAVPTLDGGFTLC